MGCHATSDDKSWTAPSESRKDPWVRRTPEASLDLRDIQTEQEIVMKHIFLAIAVALMTCFVGHSHAQTQSPKKMERLFYYGDRESAYKSLEEHIDEITIVAPIAYNVDANGVVWGEVDPRVIELARKHDVEVMPLIHNRAFNQKLLHRLLKDPVAVDRMLRTLIHICAQNKFAGIQFDFEDLNINDRDPFTNMCRKAAEEFHKHGLILSLALVRPVTPEESPNTTTYLAWLYENWRAGYDLEQLGKIMDFMSLMAYAQHTGRTTPGPGGTMPWVVAGLKYVLKYVPSDKISIGIPLSSKLWYTAFDASPSDPSTKYAHSTAKTLNYEEAQGVLEQFNAKAHWDEKDKVNYAVVDNDGLFEYLFISDARSFKAKLELVRKYNLRGFSAFVLGYEDPQIWKVIR